MTLDYQGCRKLPMGKVTGSMICLLLSLIIVYNGPMNNARQELYQLRKDKECLSSHGTTGSVGSVADVMNFGAESAVDLIVGEFLSCHRKSSKVTNAGSSGRKIFVQKKQSNLNGAGTMDRETILELITEYALKYDLEPAIVYGVCMRESTMNQFSYRYEPDYRWTVDPKSVKERNCSATSEEMLQKTSLGLMQVMGAVFREYGFRGWLPMVFADPELQLDYGCKHLARKLNKYGLHAGIAAYNSGVPRRIAGGKFENQAHVDAVLAFAESYQSA